MKPFFKNQYLDSVIKTILVLAAIHAMVLVFLMLKTGNYEVLNIFNIVGLNFLIPELGNGIQNFVVSFILLVCLYWGVFFIHRKKS